MAVTDKSPHIVHHISPAALLTLEALVSLTSWNTTPVSRAWHVTHDGPGRDHYQSCQFAFYCQDGFNGRGLASDWQNLGYKNDHNRTAFPKYWMNC